MNSDDLIKDALSDLSKLLSDNKQILKEIENKVEETEKLIFDQTCLKRNYLDKCEASLCDYFNDNSCKYPGAHGQLKILLKQFILNI